MLQPRSMIKWCKLSNYQIKKIIRCFCIDIDATKTSELLSLNRHTINRYFLLFRKAIYLDRTIKLDSIIGEVELDESYFGGKRIRGYHGKLKRGRGTLKQPVFGIFKRENVSEIVEGLNGGRVSFDPNLAVANTVLFFLYLSVICVAIYSVTRFLKELSFDKPVESKK